MSTSPDDLRNKTFSIVKKGYERGEVHRFLGTLADELVQFDRIATTDDAIIEADVYAMLATEVEAAKPVSDFILINVAHSPDERLGEKDAFFCTQAGLERAKEHLAPGGILGVWSYAERSPFADALREVFSEVRVEPVSYDNQMIDERRTDWLFFA